MQQQFEGSVCRDRQTCSFDNQHCSPFVRMNIACAHTYMAVDPSPCGNILRVAMTCLKVRQNFEGGNKSRKYSTHINMYMYIG